MTASPGRLRPVLLLALGLLAALIPVSARADVLPRLTALRINSQPALEGPLPTHLQWHPDGKRLTFVRKGDEGEALYALDVTSGRTTLLLDGKTALLPVDPARPLPLASATWLPDGKSLLVPADGDIFLADLDSETVRALVRTPQTEELPAASPDGKKIAFVRGNDLYVVDVASRIETRLTRSGSDTVLNGRLDWVYEEELNSRMGQAFAWSPDSRKVAYLQLDQARVPTFPIVDFLPVRNEVTWQRYPKAGAPNSIVRVGVVGLEKDGSAGPERLLSFDPDDVYVAPQLAWAPDSRAVAFQWMDRAQSTLELRLLDVPRDAPTPLGTPHTILTERSSTWVNVLAPPLFLKDGRRFVWISERSGFAHLYTCDLGGSCRPVTRGRWLVDDRVSFAGGPSPVVVDERTGFAYFSATEKDPRERHLYRARLDGTGFARLTREDGTHRVLLSPDARFYADTWSSVSTPPRVWVASQDGTKRFAIEDNLHPPILDYERGNQAWVELTATDGQTLYGSLLKPAGFDPSRRYPVIVSVYGGPGVQTVTDNWSEVPPRDQLLASHGFIVFKLDNRGSSGRGTAFESPIHRDLGRVELDDQLTGVEYLKSLPYVDPERIGITGWSYGGYMTLYALTHSHRVFHAGAAGAPVTDFRHYDTIYTERYMGTPRGNPEGYESSSPLAKAGDTDAELLLLHGTDDDNVHLANTIDFVDALIRAGRPYSLQVFPGERHGLRAKDDGVARDAALLAFFERTLRSGD